MPLTKPANLCQFDLPSGRTCRQVALKGEHVCRHHARNFRQNSLELTRAEALRHLEARLNEMDLPEILLSLERRLNRIVRTMAAFDEARVTLRTAIKCLQRRREDDAMIDEFTQRTDFGSEAHRLEFHQLCEKIMQPMN